MHLRRRTEPAGEDIAGRVATTLKPLSPPPSRLIALGRHDEPRASIQTEQGGNNRITAVLQEMAEQVRLLAASVDSLRGSIK